MPLKFKKQFSLVFWLTIVKSVGLEIKPGYIFFSSRRGRFDEEVQTDPEAGQVIVILLLAKIGNAAVKKMTMVNNIVFILLCLGFCLVAKAD